MERKPYPTDVSDDEWAFVAPYLTLMTEDAPQRDYPLREVFNDLRYVVRGGISWRMILNDLPTRAVVYQQMQRWLKAGVFEMMVHDLRVCCDWQQVGTNNQVARFLTVGRCNPARKVVREPGMMARSGAKAARSIWPWTRWAGC